jgi:putative NADPH-quinone reductase
MPGRIVVIQGHPDPKGQHLCHALADAYTDGAREAGYEVTRVELAELDFPLLRTQAEFEQGIPPRALRPAVAGIRSADHIVLVFPLWLGTMPALVKAFLEQVMRPGTAFTYEPRGMPRKLLAGRSARIVVTMGMPVLAYRWWFFAHGLRGLERNILRFVGIKPVRQSLYGMVGTANEATRRRWLDQMRGLGKKGI